MRGRFNGFDAWLEVGEDLSTTRFGTIIEIATVDTNQLHGVVVPARR